MSYELTLILAVSACLSLALMFAWVVEKLTGNGGWVDVIWTFSTGAAGAAYGLLPPDGEITPRGGLIAAMSLLWGLRLGLHLVGRASRHRDPRYIKFREQWGKGADARMFRFLQMQAVAAALLVMTMWLAARNPAPGLTVMDWAGVAVFGLSLFGESAADAQLAAFKRDPANKGKVNDRGLWAWSRHPNYFFEWIIWLSYALMAVNLAGDWSWGWLAFITPLYMLWLLTRVTGIPPLERHMEQTRPQAWADYKARTSVFIPLPPRRRGQS